MLKTDVIIIGGGLVGSALAIALAKSGIHSIVLERETQEKAFSTIEDGRSSAISLASIRLLKNIGAWDAAEPAAEAIRDILVLDGYSSARVHYDHKTIGNDPFGYIIPNPALRSSLLKKAQAQSGVDLRFCANVTAIKQEAANVTVELADGEVLQASLLVAADGRGSKTREMLGIGRKIIDYDQTAIVCTIKHELPHHGIALERFFPVGPFAVLPLPNNRSSLVWTEQTDMSKEMLALDDAAFIEEISLRVGDWIGKIELDGARYAYPLNLLAAERYIDQRVALVGDAAHGIHPIAGQGVNLGYRDVAALVQILAEAKNTGQDLGSQLVLEHYRRWRRFDVVSMSGVMDGLNRLFSNDFMPVKLARRFGLRAVEKMPILKGFFMRHAMGMVGDVPDLMK